MALSSRERSPGLGRRRANGGVNVRGQCRETETVFKKIVTWLVIAFVIYFVLKEPSRAGDVVRNTATALNHAGRQVLDFFDSIA